MMPLYVYPLLAFTVVVPASIGILFYRRFQRAERFIVILMIMGSLTESLAGIAILLAGTNLLVYSVYNCSEVIVLSLFFHTITTSDKVRTIIKITGSALFILAATETLLVDPKHEWNNFTMSLKGLFVIPLCFNYFFEIARKINADKVPNPVFWITGILLFYFMSSLQYFVLTRYLFHESFENMIILGNIHAFVNAFCNLSFGFALWNSTRSYSLAR